ncbi:S-adenosyl-L-methionine-dependent methyltransferase [Vararia minispora EC-137]|uniref:S-adenosyl-L-methionine-dependent methyltransferase n=1 Tax=Vararia minispora EC-137 TaxID=1314806 RepID=A0ACB8QFJ8_9AGAM|nr:S-adenosyl-L-methionine-dependent methyltransferase [Vararia minispora EC-137]
MATQKLVRSFRLPSRAFASASSSSINPNAVGPFEVFDRKVKRIQKNRAAEHDAGESSRLVDYVREEVADRMAERFMDIRRKFDHVLDLGSGAGHFSQLLERDKVKRITMLDLSRSMLHRDSDEYFDVPVERRVVDEERLLKDIPRFSQEAITSCLSLHWVNDLPGVLVQVNEALRPDGVFIGALFGGDTLFELRTSLQLAEMEREGGISPHISPMADPRDMSSLMSRAGFTLLTVDVDEVKVGYPSIWELVEDLRSMGESNAIIGRRHFLHRDTLAAASAIYKALHAEVDGTLPATFQIIYLIGWKPDASQKAPLKRGTGEKNLQDVLGSE